MNDRSYDRGRGAEVRTWLARTVDALVRAAKSMIDDSRGEAHIGAGAPAEAVRRIDSPSVVLPPLSV